MASNGALNARDRGAMLSRLASERFDVLVIGGGVTGAGTALDAASRGLRGAPVGGGESGSGPPGAAGGPGGGAGSGLGPLEPVEQAHPRRPALPGAVRLQAGLRGA